MRRYTAIYYFLFVLLIMGAFASMAQNSYGLTICGIACAGFVIAFVVEMFSPTLLNSDNIGPVSRYVELSSVTLIAFIFMLRNFSVDSSFSNNILNLILLVLLWMTIYYAIAQSRLPIFQNAAIAWPLACYYAAIVVLVFAILASSALPILGNILATVGILLTVIFVTLSLVIKNKSTTEGPTSVWQYVGALGNKSAVLMIAAILLSGFNLLTNTGVLPPLYRDKYPEGFQVLVEQGALEGNAQRAEEFETRYDQFVVRWAE
ncbi:MAG: hypothetical protein ABJA70_05260 [Chryseolinea sp.]